MIKTKEFYLFVLIASISYLSSNCSANDDKEINFFKGVSIKPDPTDLVTSTTTMKPHVIKPSNGTKLAVKGRKGNKGFQSKNYGDYYDDTTPYPPQPPPSSDKEGCESRMYISPFDYPKYIVVDMLGKVSWYDAFNLCINKTKGQYELATIKCKFEQDRIEEAIASKPRNTKRFWLNGNSISRGDTYAWGSETRPSLFSNGPMIYTKWSYGQPDHFTTLYGREECVEIISDRNCEWNDYTCGSHLAFICEKVRPVYQGPNQ